MKTTLEGRRDTGNGVRLAVFSAIAILFQIVWLYIFVIDLGKRYPWIFIAITVLSVVIVLAIYNSLMTSSIKMSWIMLILAFPVFGTFLFLIIGNNYGLRSMQKRYDMLDSELGKFLDSQNNLIDELVEKDMDVSGQFSYIKNYGGFPAYKNTDIVYYDDAAKGLEAQLKDLEKAEKFIFMEYHAIEYSASFERIHSVLRKKVKEGVEVRIFYDYVGSMGFVGNRFAKILGEEGIECRVFNPILPFLNFFINNRDHRKITVIDGKVAFTGGYNLADEYFHVTEPYGNWLDTGVRIEGDAVKSLTIIFLENWNAMSREKRSDADFSGYLSGNDYHAKEKAIVQPYAVSPMGNERVGENVYMNILRNARHYAYFITPYLMITDELNSTFAMAAKSGVDVRIITPGIPDKKMIYGVTRSYYNNLVMNGVRIFEYTPGFCHAKQCVSDDKIAVCGTINLDYRSLYHHFENGVLFYNCRAVTDMKNMFDETLGQCREVTKDYHSSLSKFKHVKQLVLRLAAPLM